MEIGVTPEMATNLWVKMTADHKNGLDKNQPIYELIRTMGYYSSRVPYIKWTSTLDQNELNKFYSRLLKIKKQRGY